MKEQKYCFLEWEEAWDEEKQKVVEIQVDVRDKPEPIFRGFNFSFCDKHGVNWEDIDSRYPFLNKDKEIIAKRINDKQIVEIIGLKESVEE